MSKLADDDGLANLMNLAKMTRRADGRYFFVSCCLRRLAVVMVVDESLASALTLYELLSPNVRPYRIVVDESKVSALTQHGLLSPNVCPYRFVVNESVASALTPYVLLSSNMSVCQFKHNI